MRCGAPIARPDTDIADVAYFEGHGTGTAVGDPTEIRALAEARAGARRRTPAALGSIKANIGHTKAAAGVAGLIKATSAVAAGVIPPTTGCHDPHPVLRELGDTLRATETGEPWTGAERVAGVSAFGFGGIDTHVVVAADHPVTPGRLRERERLLLGSAQDAELFLFAADSPAAMRAAVERLRQRAPGLSRAQLADAAAVLASEIGGGPLRAAIVATTPAELAARCDALLERGGQTSIGETVGVYVAAPERPPRIALLFPGQAAPAYPSGGAMQRRFPLVAELYRDALAPPLDRTDTAFAQPAIVRASLAALSVLSAARVEADVAVGHSLGELTALVWAGAVDVGTALRIATARGNAMADHGEGGGGMASVALDADAARVLADRLPLVVAGFNAHAQTTLSGPLAAIDALLRRASGRGVAASRLPVSHAFHSAAMAPAGAALRAALAGETIIPPARTVVSTVTGAPITRGEDVRELLLRQLSEPVRFVAASAIALADVDLAIEVGPGRILTGLLGDAVASIATDAGGPSLSGLLTAIGAAWTLGAPVNLAPLFERRFTRPIDLDASPLLFANPCERAPRIDDAALTPSAPRREVVEDAPSAPLDAPSLVRDIVAARTELPLDAVLLQSRLLDDLHLNSMAVSEIAVEAARRLGLPPPIAPTALATATVEDLAAAVASGMAGSELPDVDPSGAGSWTRAFVVDLVERPLVPSRVVAVARGAWHVIAARGDRLGTQLADALPSDARGGVALVLPAHLDDAALPLVLRAGRAVLSGDHPRRLVIAQNGGGGGGFARSLHLEAPDVATLVVDLPRDQRAAQTVATEAAAHASGFAEVRYDEAGVRRQPLLRHLELPDAPASPPRAGAAAASPLHRDDVLLLAGGATGIAAECAIRLVCDTNAAVACIGRSDPASKPALAAILERLRAVARDVTYVRADVTDADAVVGALASIEASLGPVTAVLHAAGRNEPTPLRDLDDAHLQATAAPKVAGLRNVLAALDGSPLRMLITFGSIIARAGMQGDAHYALANEWQTILTERFALEHPDCACLAFESSVWAAIGMGARLGSVEALARVGIDAIPPDDGANLLAQIASITARPVAVVAAGRLGHMPTLEREHAELPLRRFLERPRVDYPGVELVADAALSVDLDPYVADHVLDGQPLVPGVVGLEAMAQVVMALAGLESPPLFEDVRFDRPLVVPEQERTTVRVAALATAADHGHVVVRSDRTGFQVDHFSARWRTGRIAGRPVDVVATPHDLHLDCAGLYGTLLFHSGRFRRLRRYSALGATRCRAELDASDAERWFGAYLPGTLELGDLAAHDAAIHALQACVPHKRVIPVAAQAVWFAADIPAGTWTVQAVERAHSDDAFTFDVSVFAGGREIARWQGLQLRTVGAWAPPGPWPAALLATYLERCVQPLDGVALIESDEARRASSDAAIRAAVGAPVSVWRGADRRPRTGNRLAVSAAHANGLTLAVAGEGSVACDIEIATARSRDAWRDLLGSVGIALSETIAADRDEDMTTAATRVWAARECLQKIGAPLDAPLMLAGTAAEGWVTLRHGERPVATFVAEVAGMDERVALAVLTGGPSASV